MQNKVPALSIACSDEHKRFSRQLNKEVKSESLVHNTNHTQCKSTNVLQPSRKQLKPIGGPYRNSMRAHGVTESSSMASKNTCIGQRIISAKMLRTKELQNQLSDAHYHLNELANENRLLKALQKRQESALKRYEGIDAELPRIINSHHEELKVISMKYKQLRAQHKYSCDLLKEKENEIYTLQNQNKHLRRLNEDQHLEEREKLQIQVSDLTHQITQQHESIQILNRKLTLESKRLKHQIVSEATKHKETKKELQVALEKLKNAEQLLASKEKQLYTGRLPMFIRRKKITSQSLTNLQNNSLTSFPQPSSNNKDLQSDLVKSRLPKIPCNDVDDLNVVVLSKPSSSETAVRSETMASLEQVRNFRLPKSAHSRRSSLNGRISREKSQQELEISVNNCTNLIVHQTQSSSSHNLSSDTDAVESDVDEEIKNITKGLEKRTIKNKYQVPDDMRKETGYLSSDENSDMEQFQEDNVISPTSRSRNLHAKLISGYINRSEMSAENTNFTVEVPNKLEEMKTNSNYKQIELINGKSHGNINDNFPHMQTTELEEMEEIEEDLQPNIESILHGNREFNQEQSITDIQDINNVVGQSLLTLPESWMTMKNENVEDKNIDHQLIDIQDALTRKLSIDSRKSKIIIDDGDDNDDLLHYFDTNKNADGSHDFSVSKESKIINKSLVHMKQSLTTSNPVCNGSLNTSEESALNNDKVQNKNIRKNSIKKDIQSGQTDTKSSSSIEKSPDNDKISTYNKQKLLAAIKAIDDNENIQYVPKKRDYDTSTRSQVTENLYRGLPTHSGKKRDDIIRDIFGPTKIETKLPSACSKLH